MNPFKDDKKRKAIIGTVVFHLVLSVLFLFYGLKTPVPPPEERMVSIEMDLGTNTQGSGNVDAEMTQEKPLTKNETEVEETQETATEEDLATQEEAPAAVTEEETEEQEEQKEPTEEQQVSKKLQEAMEEYQNREEGGGSDGDSGDKGDEGSPEGSRDGSGSIGGAGGSWKLEGRKIIQKPKAEEPRNEEGKVVLNIWVDRHGQVIRTSPNLSKSNTTSQQLFRLAKDAAKRAKFNSNPNAAVEQKGELIFIFELE